MTQEEKARRYNEALERARQFHDKDLFAECNGNLVEYIFPELAESEDEKVRKALIRFHKSTIDVDGIKGDDIIAWLEKQAERKTPQWMIDFLDNYRRKIGCSLDYDEYRDVDGKILCIKDWLEKQSEKPQGKTALDAINEEIVDNANKADSIKLAESEDERIRKRIIHALHGDVLTMEETNKALAWLEKQGDKKPADKAEPIVVRDFNSVFSREKVKEIDKRIEKSQKLYDAKLRDAMRKVEDFPMTD